ncbi:coadhesin-like [Mytilus edulis]|uniref:coadhesin-like n=1 Tax=Mytilus edulis TaxID=6550 RepID=UPI0039EFC281
MKDEVTRLTAAITLAEKTLECWSDYGPWTDCTKTCSGGTRTRNRTCANPSPSNGGAVCSGSAVQIEACNTDPCPGHRTGVPKIGIVITDGKSNDQANTLAESKKARASGIQLIAIGVGDVSKVDGGWSNNNQWSDCTKTCGDGTRTRTRTCTNPSPSKDGAPCNGSAIQSEACNINPCPVDGGWSNNDTWSACTKTCGDGTRTRTRTCTNPSPSKGGAPCNGSAIQSEACNINPCPVCSTKADVVFLLDSTGSVGATHFKKMLKFIQGVVSKFSVGLNNIQVGIDTFQSTVKSEFKFNQFLDKNDLITAIGNIVYKTGATKTGPAIKFMTTNSFSTAAGHRTDVPKIGIVITDGKSNDQANTLAESKKARASGIQLIAIGVGDVSKVDGGWSNKDPWSACTKTCGDGTRTRSRTCTNPSPSKGGAPCNGSAIESEACNINPCPACLSGWTMYGSSCYFFSHTSEKWTDAFRICQTKNSILAEIGSSGENGFLKKTASKYGGIYWLGGTDSGREGNWYWRTSGTRFSVTDWNSWTKNRGWWLSSRKVAIQEPNNLDGKEHCLEFGDNNRYKWNDNGFWKSFKYICEK